MWSQGVQEVRDHGDGPSHVTASQFSSGSLQRRRPGSPKYSRPSPRLSFGIGSSRQQVGAAIFKTHWVSLTTLPRSVQTVVEVLNISRCWHNSVDTHRNSSHWRGLLSDGMHQAKRVPTSPVPSHLTAWLWDGTSVICCSHRWAS